MIWNAAYNGTEILASATTLYCSIRTLGENCGILQTAVHMCQHRCCLSTHINSHVSTKVNLEVRQPTFRVHLPK